MLTRNLNLLLLLAGFLALALADTLPLCEANGKINVERTSLEGDGTIRWFDWPTTSTSTDIIYVLTSTNAFYRSSDGGATWIKMNSQMFGADTPQPPLNGTGIKFIEWTPDESQQYAIGANNKIWTSADYGATWQAKTGTGLGVLIQDIAPIGNNKVIAYGKNLQCVLNANGSPNARCVYELYVSQDFGSTFVSMDKRVPNNRFLALSPPGTEGRFWYTRMTADSPPVSQFGYTDTLSGVDFHVVDTDVSGALFRYEVEDDAWYIFYAKTVAGNPVLYRSAEGSSTFEKMTFEGVTTVHYYSVPSSYRILVSHDDQESDRADLYFWSTSENRYLLSLEDVHSQTNGILSNALVDFSLLRNEGTYIANVRVDNTDTSAVRSMITFDSGGEWKTIPPPKGTPCEGNPCSLNFFSRMTNRRPYSNYQTPGLVAARGSVGPYLTNSDAAATYFSRSGGHDWSFVFPENYDTSFSDYGSLIVYIADEGETDAVRYTWTQGLNYTDCNITGSLGPLRNPGVDSHPTTRTMKFVISGERTSATGEQYSVLIHLDFSNFNQRRCQYPDDPYPGNPDSDYEEYYPHGDASNCYLGKREEIVRRRQEVSCYNGLSYVPMTVKYNCTCNRDDYECDDCFQPSGGICIPIEGCTAPPEECIGGKILITKGYSKVENDTCVSDASDLWAPSYQNCGTPVPTQKSSTDSYSKPKHHSVVGIVFLVIALIIVAITVALFLVSRKNERVRNKLKAILPACCCPESTQWQPMPIDDEPAINTDPTE